MSEVTTLLVEMPTYMILNKKQTQKTIWTNSQFECIQSIPAPRRKGSEGEKLVSEIIESLDYSVETPEQYCKRTSERASSDYDRVLQRTIKCEIKLSCSWDDKLTNWTWQQIRDNQEYDIIIFLGINPNDAHIWWATKDDLKQNIFGRDQFRQHGGKKGDNETYWISTPDGTIPQWFRSFDALKEFLNNNNQQQELLNEFIQY